jgi:regulator of cell morphogenesis and NO signaling
MGLTPETPVGAVVAERIGRAVVLERLGIDYCCHGATPLAEACGLRALDPEAVIAELEASDAQGDDGATDYAALSASALADHIEATHHVYLKSELPQLSALIDTVKAAHGTRHPELDEVRETFAALRAELESHLMKEERVLFPLIRQIEQAKEPFPIHCGTVDNPIRVMEHEHEAAGSALERLRTLTSDYQPPTDGCASFLSLYDRLVRLEADLHRHIHKENNILFPRAAALEAALARGGR